VAEGHAELLVGPSQTQSSVRKTVTTKMSDTKIIPAYSEHFKYISTMASFEDPHFIRIIRKDLIKDPHASYKAFDSLSPELVRA
jgi:hypothetical protein